MRKALLLLTILLLNGCSFNNRKNELTFINDPKIEYMVDYNSCNFIQSVKGKQIEERDIKNNVIVKGDYRVSCSTVDTKTIGKQKVFFDFNGKMYKLIVDVVDTTPPDITILEIPNNIKENEKPGPLNFVTANDPSGIASISIEGDFNTEVSGEYPLTIVATDNNGNTSRKPFVYSVKEK